MIWGNKYLLSEIFVDRNGSAIVDLKGDGINISSIEPLSEGIFCLDGLFKIKLENDREFNAKLDEERFFSLF